MMMVGMAVVSAIVLLYETKIYLKVYMLQPTNTLTYKYIYIYVYLVISICYKCEMYCSRVSVIIYCIVLVFMSSNNV